MSEQGVKRVRSDAARNRRAILDTTDLLLAQHGAGNISIEQIAAAAGGRKGNDLPPLRFARRADASTGGRTRRNTSADGDRRATTIGSRRNGRRQTPGFLRRHVRAYRGQRRAHDRVRQRDRSYPGGRDQRLLAPPHRPVLSEARPEVDTKIVARVLLSTLDPDVVLQHIRTDHTARLAAAVHTVVAAVVAQGD